MLLKCKMFCRFGQCLTVIGRWALSLSSYYFSKVETCFPPVWGDEGSLLWCKGKALGTPARAACSEPKKVLITFNSHPVLWAQGRYATYSWGKKEEKCVQFLPTPLPSTPTNVGEPLSLLQPKDKANIPSKTMTKLVIKSRFRTLVFYEAL